MVATFPLISPTLFIVGWVAEWPIAAVVKIAVPERVPGVRIPSPSASSADSIAF